MTAQAGFAAALLDPAAPPPPGLSGAGVERRFAIHRNTVWSGLIQALAARFPATERLVGDAFFAAMARAFIARHPPRSPVLHEWGDELAGFTETFPPVAALPYLPDVIRLEAARSRAHHAADAVPAGPDDRGRPLGLHPSVTVIRSAHPIVTIWAMNVGELALRPIADWAAEDALIVRPNLAVLVRRLPPGAAAALLAIDAGATCTTATHLDEALAAGALVHRPVAQSAHSV